MKNKNKEALIMIICGVIMVITLVILISIKPEKKQVSSNNTVESLSNTVDLDGFDESDLIIENLPFIRLNYYDEETRDLRCMIPVRVKQYSEGR